MPSRLELKTILESIIGSLGKVYFQPPTGFQISYPCIKYEWDSADTIYADNSPYRFTKRYQVTFITKDPDSDVPDKIAKLPKCSFDRRFVADGFIHDVFNIYF